MQLCIKGLSYYATIINFLLTSVEDWDSGKTVQLQSKRKREFVRLHCKQVTFLRKQIL